MAITIREYGPEHTEAVRQFNERLKVGGAPVRFPLSPIPAWLPKLPGRRLFQEHYLALDDAAAVRGAYILKHQEFWVRDRVVAIGDFQLPISEGAVNKNYPQIGVHLVRNAIQRQPLLYSLGIGGYREPLTLLLQAAGWQTIAVPFFFRVVHPAAFLRHVSYLRRSVGARLLLDALAFTGLGWLGIHGIQTFCRRSPNRPSDITVEQVDEFAEWADEIWEGCKSEYGLCAVRDAETLRILYPPQDPRFVRVRVSRCNRPLGWAVVLNTQMTKHTQFGAMRIGSIVDCCASAACANYVIDAARSFLETQGADLIVSSQSHAVWQRAMKTAGFLRGPSNFLFATVPELTRFLAASNIGLDETHITRGDGDGPINL